MAEQHFYRTRKAYNKGELPVSKLHTLHYEEYGSPNGIPVVFMHGGPGGGTPSWVPQLFDPKAFRIVVYDQRGAGRSTPTAEIRENSPDLLVTDAEALRKHLGIRKWHICGGSWGSTLALLYAQAYPKRVSSLTLRGLFMMREKELDLLYNKGWVFFPEAHNRFVTFLPPAERKNVIKSYFNRLANPDPAVHMPAAHEWSRYESACIKLEPHAPEALDGGNPRDLAISRIEAHFFANHRFSPDDRILKDVEKIRHIPTVIIQGRYDSVCPPVSAWELKQAFPEACLKMVVAGHSTLEPEIFDELRESIDRIRDTGSPVPKP